MCKTLELKTEETTYTEIMQRLVKRYLFKLERAKDEKEIGKDDIKVLDYVLVLVQYQIKCAPDLYCVYLRPISDAASKRFIN